jgi:hypothetical protein
LESTSQVVALAAEQAVEEAVELVVEEAVEEPAPTLSQISQLRVSIYKHFFLLLTGSKAEKIFFLRLT